MMSAYTLIRTTPEGDTRTQGPLTSKRQAARALFFVLLDNGATRSAREATRPAKELEAAPVGTVVEAFGYTFRLLEVSA